MRAPRNRLAAALVLAIALSSVASLFAPPAHAHAGDQSYLYLDVGDGLDARLHMPFTDIEEALGIELDASSADEILDRIDANADALAAYAKDHVQLRGPDGAWELATTAVGRAEEGLDYVEVAFSVDHPEDFRVFEAELDPFFDEIDDRDALLLIASDLQGGVLDNDADHLLRFTPGSRTAEVDLGNPSQWKNFSASIGAGVDHIRTGPDHILFVFALLIPSVLFWTGTQWKPATSFRSALWRITKILTMFTIAHSVTFTLAGIGLLPDPGAKVTETVIALSIAATAIHSLRPVFADKEWAISFAFGLFHGFGFASLVNELDVGTGTQLISLLGRNIGIEIGQIVVVLLIFPGLYLLRRTPIYQPFLVATSVVLVIISILWMYERIFEKSVGILERIDDIVAFPRVLIFVAIFTAIAAALHQRFDQSDPNSSSSSTSPAATSQKA